MVQITWLGHATFEIQFRIGRRSGFGSVDYRKSGLPGGSRGFKRGRCHSGFTASGHSDHVSDLVAAGEQV